MNLTKNTKFPKLHKYTTRKEKCLNCNEIYLVKDSTAHFPLSYCSGECEQEGELG